MVNEGGHRSQEEGQKKKTAVVEDKKARIVTFSKRRSALFKKASELSAMCGAEVAIITFSPSGKPYAFGSPSVEKIINKYTADNNITVPPPTLTVSAQSSRLAQLYKEYAELQAELEAEERRGEELRRRRPRDYPDISKMNCEELAEYKAKLEDFKRRMEEHFENLNKNNAV
ncbi:agamous-like MADS-box protein AGL61 [Prosopis cineraria]|uniref:agamous-like MADS-box protein AGL61 n=1 Tax=Prosopis cineraria TaxID=364024 RepID=UPI0024107DAD|nr:agamous-like MADS-box protein AGL61 [Prosopis cineraria]